MDIEGISTPNAEEASILSFPDRELQRVEQNHNRLMESSEWLSWLTERRRIDTLVLRKFQIGCFVGHDGRVHYSFPYFQGFRKIGNIKYRTADKQLMYFRKNSKHFLFNSMVLRRADAVLVVEGEMDCLAAYSYRLRIPCVSVGLGAGTVKPGWRNDFQEIRQVLICFDNDPAGQSGALKLAELLGREKCRLVRLPSQFKDLNECLIQGIPKEEIDDAIQKSLSLDQAMIFDAIEKIAPDEPVLGEKLKPILEMIAERPTTEAEDYMRAIRNQFPEVSYRQILDFRQRIKTIQHFKKEAAKDQPSVVDPEVQQDIKDEALLLLKNPNILNVIEGMLTDQGCIGEETNKIPLWLFMLSRKLDKPIHATVFGQSSSGKSELVKTLLKTVPEEDVLEFTSMTSRALDYRDDGELIGKVIFIAEMDGADDITYSIRIAQSEGRLIRGYTVKDELTGEMRNVEKITKVKSTFILTTTRSAIHNENNTRCFSLYADESVKQTQRVIEFIKMTQSREYKKEAARRERWVQVLKVAQTMLEPVEVNIGFAHLITFPDNTTRNRRDMGRFLSFLKVITFLRQHQKEVKTDEMGKYIDADSTDYALAHRYLLPIIRNTLEDLTPRSFKVLEVCCLVQASRRTERYSPDDEGFTVKDLQEKGAEVGADFRNAVNVRQELQQLCEQEYIELTSGAWGQKGGRHKFRVIAKYDLEDGGTISNISNAQNHLLTPDQLSELLSSPTKK